MVILTRPCTEDSLSPWPAIGPAYHISREGLSDSSVSLMRQWLDQCTAAKGKHVGCGIAGPTPLPKRLVHVGDSGMRPRLYLPAPVQTGRFAALSHCWGGKGTVRTLLSNLSDSLIALPEPLPRTFADALAVTRALDIEYIWIDSLCIIQDDPTDWAAEAAQMAHVYANAYVTISADAAKDTAAGFLQTPLDRFRPTTVFQSRPPPTGASGASPPVRAPGQQQPPLQSTFAHAASWPRNSPFTVGRARSSSPAPMPLFTHVGTVSIPPTTRPRQTAAASCRRAAGSSRSASSPGAPSTSPRTRRRGSAGPCATASARRQRRVPSGRRAWSSTFFHLRRRGWPGLAGAMPGERCGDATQEAGSKDGIATSTREMEKSLEVSWRHNIVQAYTRLGLTVATDRLPVLAGLADAASRLRPASDGYLAGLWRSSLVADLLWRAAGWPESRRLPDGCAPSWSWGSLTGAVTYDTELEAALDDQDIGDRGLFLVEDVRLKDGMPDTLVACCCAIPVRLLPLRSNFIGEVEPVDGPACVKFLVAWDDVEGRHQRDQTQFLFAIFGTRSPKHGPFGILLGVSVVRREVGTTEKFQRLGFVDGYQRRRWIRRWRVAVRNWKKKARIVSSAAIGRLIPITTDRTRTMNSIIRWGAATMHP